MKLVKVADVNVPWLHLQLLIDQIHLHGPLQQIDDLKRVAVHVKRIFVDLHTANLYGCIARKIHLFVQHVPTSL